MFFWYFLTLHSVRELRSRAECSSKISLRNYLQDAALLMHHWAGLNIIKLSVVKGFACYRRVEESWDLSTRDIDDGARLWQWRWRRPASGFEELHRSGRFCNNCSDSGDGTKHPRCAGHFSNSYWLPEEEPGLNLKNELNCSRFNMVQLCHTVHCHRRKASWFCSLRHWHRRGIMVACEGNAWSSAVCAVHSGCS